MIERNKIKYNQSSYNSAKAIVKMLLSFGCIIIFMMVLAPEADNLQLVKPVVDKIDERGIDASALFYTEIDEFSEAELTISTSLKYSPAQNKTSDSGKNH